MLDNNKQALNDLGQAIRSERKSQGLNQTELADLSGASLNFISQLEAGKTTVRLDKVLDVLDTLGMQFRVEIGQKRIHCDSFKGDE